MEDLIALVAASFARHGIHCPDSDSTLAWTSPDSHGLMAPAARQVEPSALLEHNFRNDSRSDLTP